MGKYWDRFLLRNDFVFDNLIEEVARDHAIKVLSEPDATPLHAYRVAMAERILAPGDDPVVDAFHRALKDRAVRTDAFLTEAFKGSPINMQTGEREAKAHQIPDAMLEQGIAAAYNDATLEAWPTIAEDVDAAGDGE